MLLVHLWAKQDTPPVSVGLVLPDGGPAEVLNQRIFCRLYVAGETIPHEAIVDTGAPTTVFPFRVWQRFASHIDWRPFSDRVSMKPATLGGVAYRYKFGRVAVRLAGREQQPILPPVDVLARFEQPDPTIPPSRRLVRTLVGLQLGPLEGRFLVVGPRHDHPERCEAWVTDAPP